MKDLKPELLETIFFEHLEHIKEYLPDIVIVGGWVPFLYERYIWHTAKPKSIATKDIDQLLVDTSPLWSERAAFAEHCKEPVYRHRHLRMGHATPFKLAIKDVPVDFLAVPTADKQKIQTILGHGLYVDFLNGLELLLQDTQKVTIQKGGITYEIKLPGALQFILHKLFVYCETRAHENRAKDLFDAFIMLQNHPDRSRLLKGINQFAKWPQMSRVQEFLVKSFDTYQAPTVLAVEAQITGYGDKIALRKSIWKRFQELMIQK